jgi:hypothetical protein
MMFMAYLLVVVVAATALPAGGAVSPTQAAGTPTYEEFAQLPSDRREAVWAHLTPETKAVFLRARFERWLSAHRTRLNPRQIAVVKDATELVTPEMFRNPPDAKARERQDVVSKNLFCALGGELAYSFAKGEAAPGRVERTWAQALQSWTGWIFDCVVK